eukprot:TRINITY_DN471_c0_g1_i1.p1 TRINITY_DN471_c0_g1~~TRINITY_DN471_c0_g1_i1.p1  ORF type:complete len:336 (-),score=60.17 TRINITY_DN471_c0_g1_i1:488-1495(-)
MDRHGSNNTSSSSNRNAHTHLGINRNSHRIGKGGASVGGGVGGGRRNNSHHQPPHHQQNQHLQSRQPPHPPVYNINKKDFRDLVQLLTGSPSPLPDPAPPPPPNPKPPNSRLQKIRPPPLNSLVTPPNPSLQTLHPQQQVFNHTDFPHRPPLPPLGAGPPPVSAQVAFPGADAAGSWPSQTPLESPVSLYMRYLQTTPTPSTTGPGHRAGPPMPSPKLGPPLPSPKMGPPLPSPKMGPPLPSPKMMMMPSPATLNSPSQFLLPSPLQPSMPSPSFFNLSSPGSAFPFNFGAFPSPSGQQGFPNFALPSPGMMPFPVSPGGRYRPTPSPRWRQPPP